MTMQSRFIKLPGELLDKAHVEANIPCPEALPAFVWISRNDIQAVMEAFNDNTGKKTSCHVYCKNGDSFYCTLPAQQVMAKIDKHDRESITYPFN
jgi:hypothetical protein